MDLIELTNKATDGMTVRRVYGEPIAADGALLIPAAWVAGGAGGGTGDGEQGSGSGAGSGFVAVPAGVYQSRDGQVSWHPAINVNLAILGGQAASRLVRSG